MRAVTAARPLCESFIHSGSYRDATWRPHVCACYRRGERGARRAAVVLHVSWEGRTLWAHDALPMSSGRAVPIMGPGATVGLVGTRVPMDLSTASPGEMVDKILLSTRRNVPRETARKKSSREC